MMGDENLGQTTNEALTILHEDIKKALSDHHSPQPSKWQFMKESLDYRNEHSTFSCISAFFVFVSGLSIIVTSFYAEKNLYGNLIGDGILVIAIGIFNIFLICWENQLRQNEIPERINSLLQFINECKEKCVWRHDNYPHLCSPYSPCITLQWTYRDGKLVNLPWALLCRGDVIILRPGQPAPGNCYHLDNIRMFLSSGEIYSPPQKHDHITMPTARVPFSNKRFVLQETPLIRNIKEVLEASKKKNITCYDRQRDLIMSHCLQYFALPFFYIITILVNLLHYIYASQWIGSGHWSVMFFLIPASVSLPFLPLCFPFYWIAMHTLGNAKLSAFLQSTSATKCQVQNCHTADPFEDISIAEETEDFTVGIKWGQHFIHALFGSQHSLALTRSSNPLHILGSVTALCCVDKKGILSWPNPTAEKIFILKTSNVKSGPSRNPSGEGTIDDNDVFEDDPPVQEDRKLSKQETCTSIEVLDLTHDLSCPFKLEFDDTKWQEHLGSLKPIGLAILLNTCNMATQEHYIQFCSHVTCEALYNEDLVPVTNRRCPPCVKEVSSMFSNNKCLCELSKRIGFTENAKNNYTLLEQLSTFRHVQPETVRRDIKFAKSLALATKLKLPFPHMVAVVIGEVNAPNSLQLFSQATGDIALDSCVDFWDGSTLRTLSSSDRKKILDFYQRTSLTAYCTAFAYRPLGRSVNSKLSHVYMELPADSHTLYVKNRSPTPLDWDLHQSTDSLFGAEGVEGEISDIESCFEIQCNQIFLGMVTMQYQAQIEMVQLIEQLERACIRFVHFSKENELRSRVFSEKMGLESGWNCHISLLSSDSPVEPSGEEQEVKEGEDWTQENTITPLLGNNLCGSLEGSRNMSVSAPCAINAEIGKETSEPTRANKDEDLVSQEGWQSLSCLTDSTEQSAPINFDMSNRGAMLSHTITLLYAYIRIFIITPPVHIPNLRADEKTSINNANIVGLITECVRYINPLDQRIYWAKLPRGIEQIRPHLEQVDNVPLLVSLFTDCTPSTTQEMIGIMQEYGETVCVMGSSANADNSTVFLQANASVSVEPLYPQVCQKVPVYNSPTDMVSPVQLSQRLNSLPCSVSITRQRPISLFHLIMHARHYMQCLWNCVQFWVCGVFTISVLQVIAALTMLPPLFSIGQIMWLCCAVIPVLAMSLVHSPVSAQIMQRPGPKSQLNISSEVAVFVLWCYGLKFLPSVLLVPLIFGAMLSSHCQSLVAQNATFTNLTCTVVYPIPNLPLGGWEKYHHPLSNAQLFASTLITYHLVMVSLSFVHREYLCWRRSPFRNKFWLFTSATLLFIQTIYTIIAVFLTNEGQNYELDTPWIAIALAFASPLVILVVNEFVKWQEIKANLRYEKRARLDFGTKLGMNSPF